MKDIKALNPDSIVVAAGREDAVNAPLNVPLVPASNYILGGEYGYSRDDATPTWKALEDIVGGIENARCISFSSGMAAVAAIFAQLKTGAKISLPDDCYQGVVGLAEDGQARGFWTVQRIAVEDTRAWIEACKSSDLIWLESPSNPLLKVAELDVIGTAPRKTGTILAVDNTLATALNQQPLDYGADVAIQSATKFIGGHSDLLSGVLTTRDEQLLDKFKRNRTLHGATPGGLESFLATRGIRTMAIRLAQAQKSANTIAHWLTEHPNVIKVRYPGLSHDPGHEVAKRIMQGFSSLISFELAGTAEQADRFCKQLQLIRHATSLGGVETTLERRAAVPGQEHLPPTLIRMCIGIENAQDLMDDLQQAIENSIP